MMTVKWITTSFHYIITIPCSQVAGTPPGTNSHSIVPPAPTSRRSAPSATRQPSVGTSGQCPRSVFGEAFSSVQLPRGSAEPPWRGGRRAATPPGDPWGADSQAGWPARTEWLRRLGAEWLVRVEGKPVVGLERVETAQHWGAAIELDRIERAAPFARWPLAVVSALKQTTIGSNTA